MTRSCERRRKAAKNGGRSLLAALAAVWLWLAAAPAAAHPLGQNAFNRDAAILVAPDRVRVEYLLDLAEIPTLSVGEEADVDRSGQISDGEWAAYAQRWSKTLPRGLVIEVDGKPLDLQLTEQDWALAPGQSGLQTLRLLARLEAPLPPSNGPVSVVSYHDQTLADRLGWKEVWIQAGPGMQMLKSDVPQEDRTRSMTDFTPRPEGPPALLSGRAELKAIAGFAAATAGQAPAAKLLFVGAKTGAAQPVSTQQELSVWSFFKLGVHHIATGWDHLVFLLGLVLMSRNLRQLTITVTAFTVAHSVTLGLAASGLVRPPGPWVEALIAATIAYVGIVALRRRLSNHGPALAFGFGLVHGFGFAGALAQSLGEGNELRLVGLLSFNLGIEALQLGLVCAVVPVLRSLAQRSWYGYVYLVLASFVFLSGTVWFLFRTVGEGLAGELLIGAVVLLLLAFLVRSIRRREILPQT